MVLFPWHVQSQDERFNKAFDVSSGYRTKSVLCMPFLSSEGVVVGVIQLINKEGGPFNSDDVEIMESFIAMARPIIEVRMLTGVRVRGNSALP